MEGVGNDGFAVCHVMTGRLDTSRSPVVLVHGLLGSLGYFHPQSRLREHCIHTIDLLGYGTFRGADPLLLGLTRQVDHVASQIESLGTGRAWLVGHSLGGAIVMLLADKRPDLVRGLINVEGNFTLKDAFWSSRIMKLTPAQWRMEYRAMRADIPSWLAKCAIDPTPQRIAWATAILDHQCPDTIHAVSEALVDTTSAPEFLDTVRRIVDREFPLHLIAGRRSLAQWDVPEFVRQAAISLEVIEDAGHLMMLERPDAFCDAVARVLGAA